MNLYVGNISYGTQEDKLRELFGAYGTVDSVKIITDKYTGQSKGFGFVEMSTEEEANKAIEELNGRQYDGRDLVVDKARAKS